MRFRIGFPQVAYAPDGPAGGGSAGSTSGSGSTGSSASPASSNSSGAISATGDGKGANASSSAAPPAGGQTSTGGTSPTPPPPASGETTVGDDFFDFSGLGGSDDEDEDFDSPARTQQKPQQQSTQAGTQPPVTGAQQTGQTDPPVDGQPQQQTPSQQQAPSPQGQQGNTQPQFPTPAEPQRIAESLMANSDALIAHMAANDFALSPADIEALETDAPKHIPTLLARTFFKMQVNTYNQMAKVIPAMVKSLQDVAKKSGEGESKFYAAWPDLKADQHGELVKRYATVYRKANPQATLKQLIDEVGPMVMMAAKVTPSQQAQTNGGGNSPQPQARPVGGRPPSPFKPAIGGSAASQQQPVDDNPWSGMQTPVEDDE